MSSLCSPAAVSGFRGATHGKTPLRPLPAATLVTRLELLVSHASQFGRDVEQAKASLGAMREVLAKLHGDREQLVSSLDDEPGDAPA
jgi:hypothetical protein